MTPEDAISELLLSMDGAGPDTDTARADEILRPLDPDGRANRHPMSLSGDRVAHSSRMGETGMGYLGNSSDEPYRTCAREIRSCHPRPLDRL